MRHSGHREAVLSELPVRHDYINKMQEALFAMELSPERIGMMQPERATRQSWPNIKPLPDQRSRLSLQRVYTEQEYERIRLGFIPERMEDKWFMFNEEDTLYIHRSWTGDCIYQLTFVKEAAGYAVSEAFAN